MKRYKTFSGQKTFFGEERRLEKLKKLGDRLIKLKVGVDWEIFRPILEKNLYRVGAKGGRPPYDYIILVKILILQRYYNISDHEMEYQLNDRFSFQRFLDISIEDEIPDETTIANFRELLKEHKLMKKLFRLFLRELKTRGITGNRVRMVDASFVEVPKQRNSREENKQIKKGEIPENWKNKNKIAQKDTDARWTKKNNETHFGYKNHVKADGESKIILNYCATSANVHDSQTLESLLEEEDTNKDLYADSAYKSEETDKKLSDRNIKSKIIEKGYRGKPLSERQINNNKKKSAIRVRIEHIFGFIENSMNGSILRTIGMARAEVNIGITNLTYNIFRSLQLI